MFQPSALTTSLSAINGVRLASLGILSITPRLSWQGPCTSLSANPVYQPMLARALAAAPDGPPPLHEIMMVSPGFVAEPYSGPIYVPWTWPFFAEGRRRAWAKGRSWLSRGLALAWCRNNVPGWKYSDFKQQTADMYMQISKAYADGDLAGLEKVTTPNLFQQMREEVLRRKAVGWQRVQFSFEEPPDMLKIRFVHGRFVQLSPKSPICFVQVTAQVPSKQRFVAYNKAGSIIAGDPEAVTEVQDHWVFERKTQRPPKGQPVQDPPHAKWRLAQRLRVESGGVGT